ncbi:family 43 glycosylhydrolase [Caulobacter sp. UNC279MFTsu5.1]|uniref:family 43 glycosylhydrolase n=1 Tax=Caulobacter sp. UNC279MFTsu5.1 TaxID=1502775 RepID=UPI0008F313F7|nr:family 43 glycosylhydrolase [Caulobacter sp. UNC279MFTsu5.1]SFJ64367.1 xylan 1,4-beta-xylosidase [Caulobacter sp. UNC279MFTsu5.1]
MVRSRREALLLGLASAGGLAAPAQAAPKKPAGGPAAKAATWRAGVEGQRRADLGNGLYRNPVLSGDRPDPSLLKDGDDYYAVFSSFLYYPGAVVWRSRDLVNWTPVGPALKAPLGSVWALDIAKHDGRYFIYIPVLVAGTPKGLPFKIYVVHANSMSGPWSEPVDMDVNGYIDPGHAVGEDGKRYLFLNDGHRVKITDDGLRRDGPVEKVYDGWPIPDDWVIEAPAPEGPKILRRGGWFYLFSGQGGTAGPPTSHMVVVARSRSIHGPWENCPHNPIVRTTSIDEPWWSRGHATPVLGPAGDWWFAYHGYENGFRTLGRQMLLEPFEWTADGWPKALGGDLSRALPKPKGAPSGEHGLALSDDFRADTLGTKLAFYAPKAGYLDRVRFGADGLVLQGQGKGPADSSPLTFIAGDRSYEITVDLEVQGAGQGGLLLFYNDKLFCGAGAEADKLRAYKFGVEQEYPPPGAMQGRRLTLGLVNDENVVSLYLRQGGAAWRRIVSYEVAGYNHNMADGFMSLRPAIFASGEGQVVFRSLSYRAVERGTQGPPRRA